MINASRNKTGREDREEITARDKQKERTSLRMTKTKFTFYNWQSGEKMTLEVKFKKNRPARNSRLLITLLNV